MSKDTERVGQIVARREGDKVVIVSADDLIEVTGELAEQYGVNPPLDGRIEFAPGYVYDLAGYGTGTYPGTYPGRRVHVSAETN